MALDMFSKRPTQREDEQMLSQFRQGDVQAFELLVERHSSRLLRLIRHYIHDPTLAEDILQQVWLQLYCSSPTMSLEGSITAWLSEVARNRCIDELRRSRRRPLLFSEVGLDTEDEQESVLPMMTDSVPMPEEQLEAYERQQSILSILHTLSPPLRGVVILRVVTQLSYREIGLRLHIPDSTAKVRFWRAKRLLRASSELKDALHTSLSTAFE